MSEAKLTAGFQRQTFASEPNATRPSSLQSAAAAYLFAPAERYRLSTTIASLVSLIALITRKPGGRGCLFVIGRHQSLGKNFRLEGMVITQRYRCYYEGYTVESAPIFTPKFPDFGDHPLQRPPRLPSTSAHKLAFVALVARRDIQLGFNDPILIGRALLIPSPCPTQQKHRQSPSRLTFRK